MDLELASKGAFRPHGASGKSVRVADPGDLANPVGHRPGIRAGRHPDGCHSLDEARVLSQGGRWSARLCNVSSSRSVLVAHEVQDTGSRQILTPWGAAPEEATKPSSRLR